MANRMSNTKTQPSPALRIEAGSINCILRYDYDYTVNRNLLTIAESLSACYVEYLFLMRVILLIHLNRRTPTVAVLFTFTNCGLFGGGKRQGEAPWIQGKRIKNMTCTTVSKENIVKNGRTSKHI
jgi:hypothetical protein